MASRKEISVFLAISVQVFRESLVAALLHHDDLVIAGGWNGRADAAMIADLSPDVALLGGWSSVTLEEIEEMRRVAPATQVVVLGIPDREQHVVACAESGAAGFLTMDASIHDLVAAIRGAIQGELFCSPRSAAVLMRRVAARSTTGPTEGQPHLTSREWQVAELLDRDLSNKSIAQQLQIEVSTVKNHVHNIMRKLGVGRRMEVAERAGQMGLRSKVTLPLATDAQGEQ